MSAHCSALRIAFASVAFAGVAFLAPVGAVFAQVAGATASLSGFVVDESGKPLGGARVLILGTPRTALTSPQGDFLIDSIPAGAHSVQFRHPGFTAKSARIDFTAGKTADAEVELSPDPGPPAPPFKLLSAGGTIRTLVVRGNDIDTTRTKSLTSLVHGVRGATVRNGSVWGSDVMVQRMTVTVDSVRVVGRLPELRREPVSEESDHAPPRGGCATSWPVILDGEPLDPGYRLDDIAPGNVAAMEVATPDALAALTNGAQHPGCGAVFVWTRD